MHAGRPRLRDQPSAAMRKSTDLRKALIRQAERTSWLQIPKQLMTNTYTLALAAWFQHMSRGNELQALYDDLFGPDDDAADGEASCAIREHLEGAELTCTPQQHGVPTVTLAPIGLFHIKSWLTHAQQVRSLPRFKLLLSLCNTITLQENTLQAVEAEGWLRGRANQAMCFGRLPSWTQAIADRLPLKHWPEQVVQTQIKHAKPTICNKA